MYRIAEKHSGMVRLVDESLDTWFDRFGIERTGTDKYGLVGFWIPEKELPNYMNIEIQMSIFDY